MRPRRSSPLRSLRGLAALAGTALLLAVAPADTHGAPAPGPPPPAPAPTFLRGLLAVSAHTPARYAVGVAAEDGRAVEVYEGARLLGRYENGRHGYGWLYALAADAPPAPSAGPAVAAPEAAGDRFLAVYADERVARVVRLALGPEGLVATDTAALDLALHVAADRRYELVSVHDLDVGGGGRIFLTGSFAEVRQLPERRGEVTTGAHPTVLVELALVPGPEGLRAVVAGGGRCFTVVDPEARHWRVAADRETGLVYATPLDGGGVLAFRPVPTGIGRAPHRSFRPAGGALVDITAARGVVAVATRDGLAPTIDLYEGGRSVGRLAGSGGALAVAFSAGAGAEGDGGAACGGGGGVLFESASRLPALATAGGQVTRHRWCERLVSEAAAAPGR